MTLHIFIDGACRGNPGPSSVGVVVSDPDGKTLREHGRAIGVGTNNVAEYAALMDALRVAEELGGRALKVHSDSQLLVRQFNGQYRIKNPALFSQMLKIQELRRRFDSVELVHVPREQNRRADKLANLALDSAGA